MIWNQVIQDRHKKQPFLVSLHAFFYNQHFHKQRQVEIGKKLNKS